MKKRLFITILLIFPILVFAQQPPGNGMLFDGNSDYYTVNDNSSIDMSGNFTIEAWINPCDTVGHKMILTKLWCNGAQGSFYFSFNNGQLTWAYNANGSCGGNAVNYYRSNASIVRNNIWQHVAVVHTPTSVTLYYNGIQIAGSLIGGIYTGLLANSNQPLRVGTYRWLGGSYGAFFNGRMDEIRMWNIALTASQILSRYNGPLFGTEANLQLYHNFESISGTTINNSSVVTGAINNGTNIRGLVRTRPNLLDYPNSFSLGSDTILCDSISFSLTIPLLYSGYLWSDGTTNNIKPIVNSGTYIGSAFRDFCFTSDTISISYIDCDSVPIDTTFPPIDNCVVQFLMPNVFTPNNDGVNDLFIPVAYDCLSLLDFKIYNRWGQLIYSSTSKIEWNGRAENREKVSEGTYFWIIQHMDRDGVETYEKGFVSVFN
jgi:gliding motility-associated-like protein